MGLGREFYDRQVAYLEADDADGVVENQYHPDAVLVAFDFTIRGRDALREHFRGYLDHLGGLRVKSTDKFTETEDAIFFEATAVTGLGEAKVYDVFMLRDGKATHHFTGIISVTPHEVGEPAVAQEMS
jgi:hypothetical protein